MEESCNSMYSFYDMYDPRPQQTSVHHWRQAETVFNINQFKNKKIMSFNSKC